MSYCIYFDTETTSLIPGQICQLSYIIDGGGALVAKNFFFTVDSMDPGSQRIHKLSLSKLSELSQGRRFIDDADEIHTDFSGARMIIAHNFRFDYKFMAKEFERIENPFRYKNSFCTMKHFIPHCKLGGTGRNMYKYPKLSELGEHFGIKEDEAIGAAADIFLIDSGELHDARYDTALLYICVKKALNDALESERDKKLLDKFTT
ncbi:MAG: 3'-5' exonuclease [Clostridiales bacterium]|jgi:DNA polymerase-3 subunit epsilon|nr:3'-5' exonuclease [Clostridiales bacterium]